MIECRFTTIGCITPDAEQQIHLSRGVRIITETLLPGRLWRCTVEQVNPRRGAKPLVAHATAPNKLDALHEAVRAFDAVERAGRQGRLL